MPKGLNYPLFVPESCAAAAELIANHRGPEAVLWLERKTASGNTEAAALLGYLRLRGAAPGSDLDLIKVKLRAAAERGDPFAQFVLALFLRALDVPNAAAQWMSRSANQVFAPAQSHLGRYMFHGIGFKAPCRASAWQMYKLALRQWHIPSLIFAADWLRSSSHALVRIAGHVAFPLAQVAMAIQFWVRPFNVRSFIHVQDDTLPFFQKGAAMGSETDGGIDTGPELTDSILDDDGSHAIPAVYVFDNVVTFDGGGAYLGMVISLPLDASRRSMERFSEKQRFYLDSFFSEFGKREWNTPRESKMKIYVSMHPDSSIAAFESLDRFSREAYERGVQVQITKRS